MTERFKEIDGISDGDLARFLAGEPLDEGVERQILSAFATVPSGELEQAVRRRLDAEVSAGGRHFEDLWNRFRRNPTENPGD